MVGTAQARLCPLYGLPCTLDRSRGMGPRVRAPPLRRRGGSPLRPAAPAGVCGGISADGVSAGAALAVLVQRNSARLPRAVGAISLAGVQVVGRSVLRRRRVWAERRSGRSWHRLADELTSHRRGWCAVPSVPGCAARPGAPGLPGREAAPASCCCTGIAQTAAIAGGAGRRRARDVTSPRADAEAGISARARDDISEAADATTAGASPGGGSASHRSALSRPRWRRRARHVDPARGGVCVGVALVAVGAPSASAGAYWMPRLRGDDDGASNPIVSATRPIAFRSMSSRIAFA